MKKRIISLIMVLVMMLTFIPTTVFAAEAYAPPLKINAAYADGKVTVTVKADAYSGCMGAQVDFSFPTDKLSVTEENIICSGVLEGATKNVKTTPTGKAISAAWDDSSPRQSDAEEPLLTVTFSVIDGQTGDCNFEIIKYTFTDGDEGEIETLPAGSIGTATVTIPKAPITTVTASVDAPVKGQPLDTTVDIGTATGYTAAVEWYEGTTATGSPVTGTAKPSQFYYAKITLTAKPGETFAASLDDTNIDVYAVTRNSETELLLTHSFPQTGKLPAASVGTAPTAKSSLEYDGTKQELVDAGTATNGTMQYSLDNSTWGDAIPKGKNAGDYTVYYMVKGDSSHSDYTPSSNTVSVTIGQKGINASTVTIDPIPNQTYTGNAIEPPLVVKDGGTELKKGTDYTVSYHYNHTDAGSSALQVDGMGNYTGTKGATFIIDRAEQVLTVPGTAYVAFGNTLNLNTVCSSNAPSATLTFARPSTASLPAGTTFDAATGTVTAGNNTGSFDVTVNSDAVPNYKAALQKTITVYIVAKTASVYTEEPKANTGLKYDGTEQELVTAGVANGGTVQYSLGSSSWSTEIPTAKDAATYSVQYKIVGDAAHTDSPAKTLTVTIAPKEVTVSGITTANKAYDGGTDATVNASGATFTGMVAGDNLTITATGTFADADADNGKTVNLTLGTLGGASAGNYELAATGNQTTTTADITPRDLIVTPNPGQSKKFGAADPTLHSTNSGRVTGQIPDFSGALSRAEGEAVGQYDITLGTLALIDHFSSGFKASNYTLKMASPAVKFEITKADAPALADIELSQKYTVTAEQSKDIGTAGMPATAGTLTYAKGTEGTTGSVTIDSWNVDASGKVTYKLSNGAVGDTVTLSVTIGSDNYADTTVNVVIKLIKGSTSSGGGSYYAPVVPDMPMVYWGCTGDAVKTLQEKLNAKGFHSGNVDGIFGAKTYAAVTAFQKANSLGVDGIVGKLTWAKLYDATPVNVTPVTTQPMLRTGSRGDAVRKLQELLNAKGYTCGSVDGIFGSKTYAAVLAFQKANGLAADGIVGSLTWGKLV